MPMPVRLVAATVGLIYRISLFGISPKQTIDTSFGMEILFVEKYRIAPSAISLLIKIIAEGGELCSISFFAPWYPLSELKSPSY